MPILSIEENLKRKWPFESKSTSDEDEIFEDADLDSDDEIAVENSLADFKTWVSGILANLPIPSHLTLEASASGVSQEVHAESQPQHITQESQENFPRIIPPPSVGNVTEQTDTSPKETEVNSRTDHNDMPTKSEESTDEESDDCMGDENVS